MVHISNLDLINLFFILGIFSSWARSDLEIPDTVSKFLSIFLLLSLGLKGGHEVRYADNLVGFLPVFMIGLVSCLAISTLLFFILKKKLGISNASALAASYGSVSAVTFVTAQGMLENAGILTSGYMVAIMALMEIPAIILAIYFYLKFTGKVSTQSRSLVKSIFSTKSVVLLLGGFTIGLLMNEKSWNGIAPVTQGSFKGVLAFFLLDLGIIAQKQLRAAWKYKLLAIFVTIFIPILSGSITLLLAHFLEISRGDQILLAVLVGSASYIAAPAAVRASIPEATPSLYLAFPLALTFPMNLIIGIPYYIELSTWLVNENWRQGF